MEKVRDFYNQDSDYEWLRCERHPVEFAITQRAIDAWLGPAQAWKQDSPLRICDVGGGPGRYAIFLARKGHKVTLVDLSDVLVERGRQEAQKAGVELEGFIQANALDLKTFPDSSFDAVLLMGPLYHLHSEGDRRRALTEARRILKPHGLLFTSFIGRFASIRHAFFLAPRLLFQDPRELPVEQEILRTGVFDTSKVENAGFTDSYFAHPAEISPLIESCGFRTLDLVGCESFASELEAKFIDLRPEERELWLPLLYEYCREPSLLGAAGHLLHVGLKTDFSRPAQN